ncbi:MAG: helix-turn-helix domain-containing protein [Sporolactobacillus sp.]
MRLNGRTLRIVRRSCGLSQSDIADKIGCTKSYISMLEKGTTTPNELAFNKIRTTVFNDLDDVTMQIIVAVHDSIVLRADNKRSVTQAIK